MKSLTMMKNLNVMDNCNGEQMIKQYSTSKWIVKNDPISCFDVLLVVMDQTNYSTKKMMHFTG